LTVRELARMKGFADGTRFFDATLLDQYARVLEASPPRLARTWANVINNVIGIIYLRRNGRANFANYLRRTSSRTLGGVR